MSINFKIVTLPRIRSDGKLTVYFRVTCNKKVTYQGLGRYVLPEEWDAASSRFTKAYRDHKSDNDILRMYEQRASDLLREYERDSVPFDASKFIEDIFQPKQQRSIVPTLLQHYCDAIAETMVAENRYGNSEVYRNLAQMIRNYQPKTMLSDISHAWLSRFEHYLRATRKQKPGTIDYYLRTLRAVCNRARKEELATANWKPFAGYSTAHLREPTAKRALSMTDAQRIISETPTTSQEAIAIDLFRFSLFSRGMNLVDMAYLTHENIRDGRIEYERRKTGAHYSIALNEHTQAIIERYRDPESPYCLPILAMYHATPKQQRERIHRVTKFVNKSLRAIAKRLGIPSERLTLYSARHTYATALKERGVSVEVISQSLGHADLRTTQIYLKSFDKKVLDDADQLLL